MPVRAKIAVVEDDPDLLDSYLAFLQPISDAVGFVDPAEFLRAVAGPNPQLKPDLLITDLRLPGTDGVRVIASARLGGADFPAVLISGNLDKEAAVHATEVGVFRLLEKPFTRDALLLVVNQLLAEQELVRVRNESQKVVTRLRELHSMIKLVFSSDSDSKALDAPCLSATADDELQSLNATFIDIENQLDALTRAGQALEAERAKSKREIYEHSLRIKNSPASRKIS